MSNRPTLDDPRALLTGRPSLSGGSKRPGYRIQNAASDDATIYLYDQIAWFAVSADQFVKDLAKVSASTIHLHVNSPGGDVFDGIAMYNALLRHPARIVTHVDGLAASAASVVALAGDEIRIAQGGFVMIHNAWGGVIGNAGEMRKTADVLDQIDGSLASLYAGRMAIDKDEAKALMDAETWFSAEDAVAKGFADVVEDRAAVEASCDLSAFRNAPEGLRVAASAAPKSTGKRAVEDCLRDECGLSNAAAKKVLAAGFAALTESRDESGDADLTPLATVAAGIRALIVRN
jgi:ATP-dependent Clp protease, protease subunit